MSPGTTMRAASLGPSVSGRTSLLGGSVVDLPSLPWSDWELKASDILFARDGAGQPIRLGSGAFGTVNSLAHTFHPSRHPDF